jgi:hypothetical protein
MLPLLSLHALVAHRGDGLRPELRALLQARASGSGEGLSATLEIEDNKSCAAQTENAPVAETSTDPQT